VDLSGKNEAAMEMTEIITRDIHFDVICLWCFIRKLRMEGILSRP
jgi:hypothetical protein